MSPAAVRAVDSEWFSFPNLVLSDCTLHIDLHGWIWLVCFICFMLIESPFVAMGAQPLRYPQLATPQQQDAQENVATLWHHMASHESYGYVTYM